MEARGNSIDGKTLIDAVYQGADWHCQFVCLEYKAGSLTPFWPFGNLGVMGIIGRLYYDMASALVLTSTVGTPAAATPATLTASKSILASGYSTQLVYGPIVRRVPIRLSLLPFDTGAGAIGWFSMT